MNFKEEIKQLHKDMKLKEGVIPDNDLRMIAKKHNVDPSMFAKFWNARFPNNGDESYCDEWAQRIAYGKAWALADSQSRKALQAAGFKDL